MIDIFFYKILILHKNFSTNPKNNLKMKTTGNKLLWLAVIFSLVISIFTLANSPDSINLMGINIIKSATFGFLIGVTLIAVITKGKIDYPLALFIFLFLVTLLPFIWEGIIGVNVFLIQKNSYQLPLSILGFFVAMIYSRKIFIKQEKRNRFMKLKEKLEI